MTRTSGARFPDPSEKRGTQYRVWVQATQWLAFDVGASDESSAIEHAKYLANKGWRADNEGTSEFDFDNAETEVKP